MESEVIPLKQSSVTKGSFSPKAGNGPPLRLKIEVYEVRFKCITVSYGKNMENRSGFRRVWPGYSPVISPC